MAASKNASLFQKLATRADALGEEASRGAFPVLLGPIATRRRVTAIEFRPLLVDAMLSTHPGGFRIFLNSNGDDPGRLNESLRNETTAQVAPVRTRFSVAHELAHTLFYDISNGIPKVAKEFRAGAGKTALDQTEKYCNKLAGRFLLPTAMLERDIQPLKTITPEAMLTLARVAGVSIEALVRRLGEESSLLSRRLFRGCVVLLKEEDGEMSVRAIARPRQLNMARDLLLLAPGEEWQLKAANGQAVQPAQLPAASVLPMAMETPHGARSEHDYQFLIAEAGRHGSATSYLVIVQEAG